MKLPALLRTVIILVAIACVTPARSAANHQYKPDEYTQIGDGLSPDGQYSIRAHGEGDLGDDNFHLYLFEAKTGKKIGPLEGIKRNIDSAADAFTAKWAADSKSVMIAYRVDNHVVAAVRYRIENDQAVLIAGRTR